MSTTTQSVTKSDSNTNVLHRPNAIAPRSYTSGARLPPKFTKDGDMSPEWQERIANFSALQKHAAYFLSAPDANKIWPWDTWTAVRGWGWNPILTLIVIVVIHGGLGYWTQPPGHTLPELFAPCYMSHMHRGKHGSDSGGYSPKGSFRKQVFEETFASYDKGNKGGLTKSELLDAWHGQRVILDFFGWSAVAFEWFAVYLLVWPEDGVLRKDDAEGVYDGSLFWRGHARNTQRLQKRSQ